MSLNTPSDLIIPLHPLWLCLLLYFIDISKRLHRVIRITPEYVSIELSVLSCLKNQGQPSLLIQKALSLYLIDMKVLHDQPYPKLFNLTYIAILLTIILTLDQ